MADAKDKDYVVVVQCHLVAQRCPGYWCERAFRDRADAFAGYPKDKPLRVLYLTCGGCCGRGLGRKLSHLCRSLKANEGVGKERIAVHLSSCIAFDNFHAPPCPHLEYIQAILARLGLDVRLGTHFSPAAEKKRAAGVYAPRPESPLP